MSLIVPRPRASVETWLVVTCQVSDVCVFRYKMQPGYLQMPKLVDSQIKPYKETGATDEEEWDVVRREDVLHKRIWIRMTGICGLRRTSELFLLHPCTFTKSL